MLIVNPGSHIPDSGDGWTNTAEGARKEAEKWLNTMRGEGFADVELLDTVEAVENRWRFTFRHTITGAQVHYETHGIDNLVAYEKENIFSPRVYWRGSSSANPRIEDFAADGFEPVLTYRRVS